MSLLASDVGGDVQRYPPGNLSTYMTSLVGQSWGNGTYVASASSEAGLANAFSFAAFSGGLYWASSGAAGAAYASGAYAGTTTTSGYSGEWLQLQLPQAIVLSSYSLTSTYLQGHTPKDIALLGSVDGSTWSVVDVRTLGGSEAAISSTFANLSGGSPYTSAHSIFRLVVTSNWGSSRVLVNSIAFFGSPNLVVQKTPTVPASGTVSFAQIKAAFGNAYGSNINAYGAGVGGSSLFSFSSFRGRTGQTPSVGSNLLASVTTPLAGTSTVVTPGGGIVGTANVGSSVSINLQNYTGSKDGTLQCTIVSNTGAATASLAGSTLSVGATAAAKGTVVVRLTNQFGNEQYVTFPYDFKEKPPSAASFFANVVAMYTGESYTNGVWADITGNGNHAVVSGPVSVVNAGLNGTSAYLKGTSATRVQFPTSILPTNYTLMHVARYDPMGSSFQRILASSNNVPNDFASGFLSGDTGRAYHNGNVGPAADWGTTTVGTSYGKNWILSVDTNGSYAVNGVAMGSGGQGIPSHAQLSINNYQPSDFNVGTVAVFATSNLPGGSNISTWMSSNYRIPMRRPLASANIALKLQSQSSNVDLSSLAENCSSYSVALNPNTDSTVTFAGSSVSVTGSLRSNINYTIYVKGSASNGAYTFIPIAVSETSSTPTPQWTTLAPWNAGANAYVITGVSVTSNIALSSLCSVSNNGVPSFFVSSNPYTNASISNANLVVDGAFRNTTYNVFVNATFTSNITTSNLTSFNVSERAVQNSDLVMSASNTSLSLSGSNAFVNHIYLSSPLSKNLTGASIAYSLTHQAGSWSNSLPNIMTINSANGQLTVRPGFRGNGTIPTYTAVVTASVTIGVVSATASKSISIPVTETALPNPIWSTNTSLYSKTGLTNNNWSVDMNTLCSASVGALTYVVQSVAPAQAVTPYSWSGSTLTVTGANRGTTYNVVVGATATFTSSTGTTVTSATNSPNFTVSEYPSAITFTTTPAPQNLSGTTQTGQLAFVTSSSGGTVSYAVTGTGVSYTPNNNFFTITPANRGLTYTVTINATNTGANSLTTTQAATVNVIESPAAPVFTTPATQSGNFSISVSATCTGAANIYYKVTGGTYGGTFASNLTTAYQLISTMLSYTAPNSSAAKTITLTAYGVGSNNVQGATTSVTFTVNELRITPTKSSHSSTYVTYNGSTFHVTFTINTSDTTSISVSSSTNLSNIVTRGPTGTAYYVDGTVSPGNAPSITVILNNEATGYVTNSITLSAMTASAAPVLPSAGNVTSTTFDDYNGVTSTFRYTIIVSVSYTSSSSPGTYDGTAKTVAFTGRVAPNTTPPSTGNFRITGDSGGYIDVASKSATATSPLLPSAGNVSSTTFDDYNVSTSTFRYTIIVSVSYTSSSSPGTYDGTAKTVAFTGRVAPNTTPSTGNFRITGESGGYIDVASKSATATSPLLPSTGAVTTSFDDYNNGTYRYTIIIRVYNTSSSSDGTYDGNTQTVTFTGRVAPNTAFTATQGFTIYGAGGGSTNVGAQSGTAPGPPAAPLPVWTAIPNFSGLTTGNTTYTLSCTNASSFSEVSDPQNSVSISFSTLTIAANYRNTTYTVTLRATNATGQTADTSFTVSEVSSLLAGLPLTGLVAAYLGESYEYGYGNYWRDLSGNGRDALVNNSVNRGYLNGYAYISGTPNNTAVFVNGAMPANYLVAHVARYNPNETKDIFLAATNTAWLTGFWNDRGGVAYHNGFIGNDASGFSGDNWIVSSDTIDSYWAIDSLGNQKILSGYGDSTQLPTNVSINDNPWPTSARSGWEIAAILVFDLNSGVSRTDVNDWLKNRYRIPVPAAPLPVWTAIPNFSGLTTGNTTYTLSCTNASSFSEVSDPQNSVSISGSTLTIAANYRNTTYTVTLRATNATGQTADTSFTVSEDAAPTVYHYWGGLKFVTGQDYDYNGDPYNLYDTEYYEAISIYSAQDAKNKFDAFAQNHMNVLFSWLDSSGSYVNNSTDIQGGFVQVP